MLVVRCWTSTEDGADACSRAEARVRLSCLTPHRSGCTPPPVRGQLSRGTGLEVQTDGRVAQVRPRSDTARVMAKKRPKRPAWRGGWLAMGKSIGFVYGVPIGITLGVIAGAILEISDEPHAAATGLLIGFGSGVLSGSVLAWREIRRKLRWIRRELTGVSGFDWAAVVMALNVTAAQKHYLLVRREADYVAYTPTLVRPVAGGPLTVSGEYLSVIVSRLPAKTIAITGPEYTVNAFTDAAEAVSEAREATPSLIRNASASALLPRFALDTGPRDPCSRSRLVTSSSPSRFPKTPFA
jgi:hypothetical protein